MVIAYAKTMHQITLPESMFALVNVVLNLRNACH